MRPCPTSPRRFREALEAAVVVSVLLQLVEKMKLPLKKHGAGRHGLRGIQVGR